MLDDSKGEHRDFCVEVLSIRLLANSAISMNYQVP